MKLLRDLWPFLWGRTTHPVYRRELSGWSYWRAWRRVRRGCVPLMLLIFACAIGMCSLTSLPMLLEEGEALLAALFVIMGLAAGEELARWLTGLVATTLTATVLSAEIESETYPLLRTTLVTARDIVLAKYGAAMRQLRTPLIVLMLTRVFLILCAVGWLVALVLSTVGDISLSGTVDLGDIDLSAIQVTLPGILAGLFALLVGLTWLVYIIVAPTFPLLRFAAVGMFASSLSRTRTNGLVAAVVIRIAMGVGGYIASQFLWTMASFVWMPFALLPELPPWLGRLLAQPPLILLGSSVAVLVYLTVAIGWQIGVMLLCLKFASDRARRLPFG